VPTTDTNTAPLAGLIVSNAGYPSLVEPAGFSGNLPTAQLPLHAMVAAGASDPTRTGAWFKEWSGKAVRSADNLSIEADLAPSISVAKTLLPQAQTFANSRAAIVGAKHTYDGSFAIAPLVGSGSVFTIPAVHTPKTATAAAVNSPAQPGIALVFVEGRVVVQITVTGSVGTKSDALALARREVTLIDKVVPGLPPLRTLHAPLVASLIYLFVGVAVIVTGALTPVGVEAGRRRRAAELAARADRHRRVRGAKALKSQRRRF
jgi:hypothetical protein